MSDYKRLPLLLSLLLACWMSQPHQSALAQELDTRFGLAPNLHLSSSDGMGIGLRGRVSAPLTTEFSAAFDLGLSGFIFGGRDQATYVFDPQISGIVTMPGDDERAMYVMAGFGAYVPFGRGVDDDPLRGPLIQMGVGWVHALAETSLFYEVNPGLIIGEDRVGLSLPIRGGIIF